MWLFRSKKEQARLDREESRTIKIAASQLALIEAATTTADAAERVTTKLKKLLEDSVRQFDATSRLISDALIVCDETGKVHAFNPAAESIFAINKAEIESTSVARLFRLNGSIPSDTTLLWNSIENGDDTGDNPKLVGRRGTSETFSIDAALSFLGKSDGSKMVLLLIRDMTNTNETNRSSKSSTNRFQSLFNLSFDGILIIQNSIVVAANRPAGLLFGIEAETLLNTSSKTLLDTEMHKIPTQVSGKRSDGTSIPLLFSSTEITWNSLPAHLVTIKDVSDMRQLQQVLQNSETGFDMICVFNADFIITFANAYFNRYYQCDDSLGKDIRDLIPSSDRDTFSLKLLGMTPSNSTVRNQVQHFPGAGDSRLLDWVDHAVFDAEGKIIEYQRTGRDITNVLSSLMIKPETNA